MGNLFAFDKKCRQTSFYVRAYYKLALFLVRISVDLSIDYLLTQFWALLGCFFVVEHSIITICYAYFSFLKDKQPLAITIRFA